MSMYIDGGSASLSGIFYGTQEDYVNRIKPELLRSLPPTQETLNVTDWEGLLYLLAEGQGPLLEPAGAGYTRHDDFVSKRSRF